MKSSAKDQRAPAGGLGAARRARRTLALAAMLGGAGLASIGCAAHSVPPPGDVSVRRVGSAGGTAAVVLASPQASANDAVVLGMSAPDGPWVGRRDASLGVPTDDRFQTLGVWPSEPRDSLAIQRRLFFPRNADTYLYFDTPRQPHDAPRRRLVPRTLAW